MRTITAFVLCAIVCSLSGCVTAPPRPSAGLPPAGGVYHVVESGSTLWRISKAYGVDINVLMRSNNITDPSQLRAGQQLFIPGATRPLGVEAYRPPAACDAEACVGPKHYACRWRTITLHHSATLEGNAESFDRNHRTRGMGGLFYHFVIGNGKGCGDGQIETGWRWKRQVQVERQNDIQICLVGDFNRQQVSDAQFHALVELISVLRRQYSIPAHSIRRHKSIWGKRTDCPGKNFPLDRLIIALQRIQP